MDSDKLGKFIENMRAAGQPDEMIAESLIDAGNNRLEVLNAFGVSSMDELRDDPEPKPAPPPPPVQQPKQPAVPLVDDHGNLIFGSAPTATPPPPPAAKPQPQAMHQPHHPAPRPHMKPAPRRQVVRKQASKPVKHEPIHSQKIVLEPISKEHKPLQPPKPVAEAKPKVEPRKTALDASQLHMLGQSPTSVRHISSRPEIEHKKPVEKDHKEPENSHHSKHHSPHTFKETMEDLTDHKELEAGYDGEVESGEVAPVKRVITEHEIEQKKPKPTKQESSLDEVELPQEIAVTELEAIDIQDTTELKKVAKDADKEVEEINKPTKPVQAVPSSPELQKVGDSALSILNSTWLKVSLIIMFIAIIVALAISVMTQVTGSAS